MLLTITGCKSDVVCRKHRREQTAHERAQKRFYIIEIGKCSFFWSCDQFVPNLVAVWIPEMQ